MSTIYSVCFRVALLRGGGRALARRLGAGSTSGFRAGEHLDRLGGAVGLGQRGGCRSRGGGAHCARTLCTADSGPMSRVSPGPSRH